MNSKIENEIARGRNRTGTLEIFIAKIKENQEVAAAMFVLLGLKK